MMPLTFANVGEENMIKKVAENLKQESFLKIWVLSQVER